MKKMYVVFGFFLLLLSEGFCGTIVIEGKYQDKNLYVKNSFVENGVGFCTYEVTINGKTSTDEINSSAFEIDFSAFNIPSGAPVIVEIRHKDDCSPKVLNPDVLKAKATFEVVDITIDKKGLLSWSTKNEKGALPFIVEQFRWNKWVQIGEVEGTGKEYVSNYKFKSVLHSGQNKIRVIQQGFDGEIKASQPVTVVSDQPKVNFIMVGKNRHIEFSDETLYEVYDIYGNIVKKGYNDAFDYTNLSAGNYFLCFDNVISNFKR